MPDKLASGDGGPGAVVEKVVVFVAEELVDFLEVLYLKIEAREFGAEIGYGVGITEVFAIEPGEFRILCCFGSRGRRELSLTEDFLGLIRKEMDEKVFVKCNGDPPDIFWRNVWLVVFSDRRAAFESHD